MSLDVNRRNFLKLIFTTTPAAAVSGLVPYWPAEALSRPLMEPVKFTDDGYGYLIDPTMQYYDMAYPTFREWLGLEGLTPRQLKKQLKMEEWRFEHLISDSGDWDMTEIQAWLDSDLEPEDMGLLEGMSYTPYGPPIEFYEQISGEDSESIGLTLVEGDHPGSSFAGVQLFNTPRDANRALQRLGINVVVGEG